MWTMKARVTVFVAAAGTFVVGVVLARCSDDGPATSDAGEEYGKYHPPEGSLPDDVATPAVDAGTDAPCSISSDWPGFRRLTEFDPCLPADVLADADAGYALSWTDCGDAGIVGCKELVQVAPQVGTYGFATYDVSGGGNLLYLNQALAAHSTVQQYDVFDLKTFARLGEWRVDLQAANGTQIVLPNSTGSTTAFLGYKPGLVAEFAPAQSLSINPLALTQFPSAPTQPINWAISDEVMAWQPYNALYSICTIATATCVPMNIQSIAPATPFLTFAWHDVAFGVAEHGTSGWAQEYVIHADGSIALLRSNPNAHIWAMATDGTTLVWKEVYGSQDLGAAQTTAEVWKAPFTTDKATLDATATKVATLPTAGLGGGPTLGEAAFFNGLYATYFGGYPYQFTIYTVDLNTGKVQSSPTGPGGIMLGLPYVDRNELWEVTRSLGYQDSLVRIQFSQPWN